MFSTLHAKIDFGKIYLYLTMLLALSAPFSWRMSRVFLVLIIGTWLVEADYKKLFNAIKQSNFLIILILFVSYQLLTMFWTETSYSENHSDFNNYLLWFTIPILSVSLKAKDLSRIITAFLSAMLISEIIAYGMYFELWTIRGHGPEYPSPFMHHGAYSIFMAFAALVLLNRIYSSLYSNSEKIAMGIFFLTISGNLFISQGRIGQLAYAIAILSAGIMHFRLRLKTLLLSVIFIASLFIVAYQSSPMFQHRLEMAQNDIEKILNGDFSSSWGTRAAYIILGVEIIKDHPLIGVGIGDTRAVTQHYIDTDRVQFSDYVEKFLPKHHFHNQYLMVTVQSGLIGMFLFAALFFMLFKLPIADLEIKHISILFGIIFLIGFVSNPFLLVNETRTLFMLFASLFAAASLETVRHRQIHTQL